MASTNVVKKRKQCGKELPYIWYYYSHKITYDKEMDVDMSVLDGPFCQHCVISVPSKDSYIKEKQDAAK